MKYNFGSFEMPVTQEEINRLKTVEIFESNMPFFQDSVFHYRLGQWVNYNNIPGDFVECGVYNGMSAASITVALTQKHNSKIYLYDSWEGFPETTIEKDG